MSTPFHLTVACLLLAATFAPAAEPAIPPGAQLPHQMHAPMSSLPTIRVGPSGCDINGADNRALQSAIDYLAQLGGGTLEIAPGEYLMHDSLHLRPNITIKGTADKTILRKAPCVVAPLKVDGDYGEEQITVSNPEGFEVGFGVTIWDKNSGGFHTTVARITGKRGNVCSISKPLNADCMVADGAKAATIFPVVSGYDLENVRLENLIIEGDKDHNVYLNGCRGGGIFLYRGFGTIIENCKVKHYNGDGISFQQSNDCVVTGCLSEGNSGLGFHPGSGSQRPTVKNCIARGNGEDGLYLCWRVQRGLFEDNLFEANGRYGISIGHKDTDNLLRHNRVIGNTRDGICFRNETEGMAAHRNRLEENTIENNGQGKEAAGIRIMGQTNDLIFKNNIIRDTRPASERKQTIGVQIDPKVGPVTLEGNQVDAREVMKDQRAQRN